MTKDTNGNGGIRLAIKVIGLAFSALALFGALALAWTTINSRVTSVEVRQYKDTEARDKFERRIEQDVRMVNRKLDALILHTGAKAPK